ncbi:MAG: protein kinase [Kofleriaceae bacterium]
MTKPPVDPMDVTHAESIRPGKMTAGAPLGGYELLEVLGEGGMGVVWSAHDPNLDRMLAIKVLKRSDAPPALRKRLLREARAMARLKHPNVLTVYEVGTEGDRDFIAMEVVDGGSLDEWLTTKPPRGEVIAALIAAGRGLAAAHAAGLVHRDFKPHNILRSREGRVLVTDFGLARGVSDDSPSESPALSRNVVPASAALDTTLDATPPPAPGSGPPFRPSDSVLDSTLTQTGALLGTPAYMAPEQFAGAVPDPRTDQFSFSVTAWQALTGSRPYSGSTIDELRLAAASGCGRLEVDLPPAVREVLARGLDPDPDNRWPNLDALLDALDQTSRTRRSPWRIVGMVAAVVVAATAVVLLRPSDKAASQAAAVGACEPADAMFAEAWSPTLRSQLERERKVSDTAFARVADAFDDYRRRWTASYDAACSDPKASLFHARIGCLRGVRDHVSALSHVLRGANEQMYQGFDAHGILPNLTICSGPSPVAAPAVPDDQPRRTQILDTMAATLALRAGPIDQLESRVAKLEADASAIGWQPLLPQILVAAANEYLRIDVSRARALFQRAVPEATEAHDTRLVAAAQLGLLDASLQELEQPSPARAASSKQALHPELEARLTYAKSAIRAAGSDELLIGAVAALEARAVMDSGEWLRRRAAYQEAPPLAAQARSAFEAAGDLRRAAMASSIEAESYLRRGDERALDDAMFAVRSAEESLARARLASVPALAEIGAIVAFSRGDYAEAHRQLDRGAGAKSPRAAPSITGRVVDASGKPVASARVVAWHGELHGDPIRVYTDPRAVTGEVVECDLDGTFTIHAAPGDAIIAERAGQRSTPTAIDTGELTLKLGPTSAVRGAIDARTLVGVDAVARFTAGAATWVVHAPIDRNKTFHLAGLPRGGYALGAFGDAGDAMRWVTAPAPQGLHWPIGTSIEVIARPPIAGAHPTVWLFRGKPSLKTRGDADALARKSSDVAIAALRPIGSRNTERGRELYEVGGRHAVITGNPDGPTTACAAFADEPTAPLVCKVIEVRRGATTDPATEYSDGRYGGAVVPVVLDAVVHPRP